MEHKDGCARVLVTAMLQFLRSIVSLYPLAVVGCQQKRWSEGQIWGMFVCILEHAYQPWSLWICLSNVKDRGGQKSWWIAMAILMTVKLNEAVLMGNITKGFLLFSPLLSLFHGNVFIPFCLSDRLKANYIHTDSAVYLNTIIRPSNFWRQLRFLE